MTCMRVCQREIGSALPAGAGSGQASCPFSRHTRAMVARIRAVTARTGWKGANQVRAPVYPSASSAILLHTGHPTANQARTAAAQPARAPPFSDRSTAPSVVTESVPDRAETREAHGSWSGRTYVATRIAIIADVSSQTG